MTTEKQLNLIETVPRVLAGLVGLIFLMLGIGFLTLPEVFATQFFAEPARAVGINSIRGDFGALFLGMSFFCLLGTLTAHRRLLLVPIVFLTLVVTGRVTSVIVDDVPMVAGDSIRMELIFIVILTLSVVTFTVKRKTAESNLTLRGIVNRRLIVSVALILILIAGIFRLRERIGMRLLQAATTRFSAEDVIGNFPDGLHVGLAGAGAPLPDGKRVAPCAFVIAGKKLFIVDSGPGSTRQMELMRLPLGDITAVLLTHYHSDHIGGLGELLLKSWAGGARKEPLHVFGPKGVEEVVGGFNLAYSIDAKQRVAHHGPETVPPTGAGGVAKPFDFPDGKDEALIIDDGYVKITAFLVDHRPVEPAVGYRFDYKGRSLVVSGDTLPCDSLRRQAAGVDLLLHEALQPKMVQTLGNAVRMSDRAGAAKITEDIPYYHTFPEEAARIARETGAKHLVLCHIIPPLPVAALNAAFVGDAKRYYNGPITIGVDGMLFSMPSGNKEIHKKWLLTN
jgi:ribonuclease Z